MKCITFIKFSYKPFFLCALRKVVKSMVEINEAYNSDNWVKIKLTGSSKKWLPKCPYTKRKTVFHGH